MSNHPVFESMLEQEGAGFTYFRRHAGSFEWQIFLAAYGSLVLLSLVIAAGFVAAGAWVVVPFIGLEVVALLAAAAVFLRRRGDFERLQVRGDRILVERRDGGVALQAEFHCGWARLVAAGSGAVALRSHGKTVEIGRYCSEDGRRMLARELRWHLGDRRSARINQVS